MVGILVDLPQDEELKGTLEDKAERLRKLAVKLPTSKQGTQLLQGGWCLA